MQSWMRWLTACALYIHNCPGHWNALGLVSVRILTSCPNFLLDMCRDCVRGRASDYWAVGIGSVGRGN